MSVSKGIRDDLVVDQSPADSGAALTPEMLAGFFREHAGYGPLEKHPRLVLDRNGHFINIDAAQRLARRVVDGIHVDTENISELRALARIVLGKALPGDFALLGEKS